MHQLLVGYLEPFWERRFIYDFYACRTGKGTHQVVERLRAFTRQVTANRTRRAWYLQRDVRGFFITLDRHILFQQLAAQERDPAGHWLLRVILCQDLTANCRFRRARRADFERLPPHKTLFKAQPGCGLPIGNLTSQFFANVYLDPLDQLGRSPSAPCTAAMHQSTAEMARIWADGAGHAPLSHIITGRLWLRMACRARRARLVRGLWRRRIRGREHR